MGRAPVRQNQPILARKLVEAGSMADKGASSGVVLGLIAGTLAAIGGGFAFGAFLLQQPEPRAAPAALPPLKLPQTSGSEVKLLAPIVANLGNPADTYVRLEGAILLEPATPDTGVLAAKVSDDLVAYLRTVSITEIQGATGFQYFREDLKQHAIKQGGGKVRDFFILTFAVE